MKGTKKGIVLALVWGFVGAGAAAGEPSYLIYPSAPTVFRYDTGRYELVTPGNPKFDSRFAVANQMLWDRVSDRVPLEVYRAPTLIGFEASSAGRNEFITFGNSFDVIVDGYGPDPRTLGSLRLRFWPEPATTTVDLSLGGQPMQQLTVAIPALEVLTLLPSGFYADSQSYPLEWNGPTALRIVAFSDKDGDGAFQGTPLFSILAFDAVVSVQPATWGRVKSLYR